jgi:hypothetical protein
MMAAGFFWPFARLSVSFATTTKMKKKKRKTLIEH